MKDISISLFSFIRCDELQLALNNILFRAILDAMPCGVFACRAVQNEKNEIVDFVCFFANNVVAIYMDKEIVGKTVRNDFSIQNSEEFFQQLLSITKPFGKFIYKFSNNEMEVNVLFEVIKLQDGILVTHKIISDYSGVTPKNTSQKKAEEELKEQTHFIHSIAEAMPDILFVLNLHTNKIVYVNHAVEKLLGYADEQILQMKEPLFELMYEEDIFLVRQHLEKIKHAADGEVLEIEYRMKDVYGNLRWFCDRNTVFKRDEQGNAIEKLGISQDITSRKQSEEEVRKQHNILKQSEELANIGSWEYDINTKQFLCSDGMYSLLEIEKGLPIIPAFYLEYAKNEDIETAKKIVDQIQNYFNPIEETLRIQHGDINKTIRVKGAPLKNKKGEVEKMLGVNMDITNAKEAEQKIFDLNKNLSVKNRELETLNSELKTFNTIAANDYKDTLSNLYTNLEFIISKDGLNLSDGGKANLRRAQSSIQKIKLLTDDIVSFSNINIDDNEIGYVDLNSIVENILSDMEDRLRLSNAQIEIDQLPKVKGYQLLLSLLFHHLLDNAIKFRKNISTPIIHIQYALVDDFQHLDFSKETAYHKISVIDNGIGFSNEDAKNIFSMFYKLHEKNKYKGSGIGLSICKKIMDLHNGFITALGNPEISSEFSCYFPAE